jgi:NAD+ synthase
MFDAKKVKDALVKWIREWFEMNGPGCNAVIGISGGKDSTIVAALCVEALGKDRVIGVMMPDGYQADMDISVRVANWLEIDRHIVNIGPSTIELLDRINECTIDISTQTLVNLPPRIRMATLYAVAQSVNGRVSCNSNFSERFIGYSTRWGDGVGDFAPLANLTVSEVKAIGYELGLPKEFIEKVPSDGLCGKTDEDNLGFSYDVLDRYIRTGECEDVAVRDKIEAMHKKNEFKLRPVPNFEYPMYRWDDILGWVEEEM